MAPVLSAPGAGMTTAVMGDTDSDFTDGPQRIDEIDVQEGSNLLLIVDGTWVLRAADPVKRRHYGAKLLAIPAQV